MYVIPGTRTDFRYGQDLMSRLSSYVDPLEYVLVGPKRTVSRVFLLLVVLQYLFARLGTPATTVHPTNGCSTDYIP